MLNKNINLKIYLLFLLELFLKEIKNNA